MFYGKRVNSSEAVTILNILVLNNRASKYIAKLDRSEGGIRQFNANLLSIMDRTGDRETVHK